MAESQQLKRRLPGYCPDCDTMGSLPPMDVEVRPVKGERGYVEHWVCSAPGCSGAWEERYAWVPDEAG